MNTRTGLWIDQGRAIIVALNGGNEKVKSLTSQVTSQPRRASDTPAGKRFDAHHIPADATRSRTHARDLRVFYDRILRELPGAGDLLLLGPGRAKTDFRKHLQSTGWAGRVRAVKSADKMSDRQFVALVREFFQRPDETPSPAYRPWYTSASASRMLSSSLR